MKIRVKQFIFQHKYLLIISSLVLLIAFANYIPGTFLSGWDTLHPEFDFGLNFQRLFFGVWRGEQGLGAVSGHSAMADIPRVIILWLLHFLFPLNSLKYLYNFLCLAIGPIGIYYLINYLLQKKSIHHELIGFLTALFYLFNLSTAQQFYVPFEMFPTQYAYLPWIMLFSLQFLQQKQKKSLLYFAVVTLLATPQAYAAHLWYPFFGMYGLFLICYLFLPYWWQRIQPTKGAIINAALLIIVTLTINSFWLLPNLYFIKTNGNVPEESKQNRLFSQEYRLRNRENGYLKDVALIKGFYFDWQIYDFQQQKFVQLMDDWRSYLNFPLIPTIGYLFFIATIIGLTLAIWKKDHLYISIIPFFVLPFIFLMNHTFPFEQLFNFLLNFSLSEEALRFTFTKFSIVMIFAYVIYFSYFLFFITEVIPLKFHKLIILIVTSSLLIYCLPIFTGHLISDKVRIKIPQNYFDFWNYMKTQDDGVVLSLPLHTFSGWQYYDWQYQGSGFLWFGLKQPLMDRDSDRWSISNEQAYREFSYALYARNTPYFSTDLDKYNVQYIVWDTSNIAPTNKNAKQITYERETQQLLDTLINQGKIKFLKQFGEVYVFKITDKRQLIETKHINYNVLPAYRWNYFDFAYKQLGDYATPIAPQELTVDEFYYPYRNIINAADRLEKNTLEIDTDTNLTNVHVAQTKPISAHFPNYSQTEDIVYANLFLQRISSNNYQLLFNFLLPNSIIPPFKYSLSPLDIQGNNMSVEFNNQAFSIPHQLITTTPSLYIGQVAVYTKQPNYVNSKKIAINLQSANYSYTNQIATKLSLDKIEFSAKKIGEINQGKLDNKEISYDTAHESLMFHTTNHQNGVYINLDSLSHTLGYILVFQSKNITGLPLRICIKNLYSNLCSLYDELSKSSDFTDDYFFIPSSDNSFGYGISIDNISFGNYDTKNAVRNITVIPYPYTFLSQVYYHNYGDILPIKELPQPVSLQEIFPFIYKANLSTTQEKTLILHSTFATGWNVYPLENNGLFETFFPMLLHSPLNHILIDNWANGWQINPSTQTAVIIFWPQYLELTSIVLIVLLFLYLIMYHWYEYHRAD